jgi:hypothetical protein
MQEEKKEVTFKDEISAMEYEPLNEVEMKLIKWSMGLGVGLLVVFYLIAQMVPGAH